jgi:hypothetical protein
MMTDRLLFARALNDAETALAIQEGQQVLVGVAILYRWEHRVQYRYDRVMDTELTFRWVWWQYGDLDEFINTRGWERPPARIESRLQIERK